MLLVLPHPLAWNCLLASAAKAAPTRHSSERMKGAVRSTHWIRRPEKKWDYKMVNYTESGVLSTACDLVFAGEMEGTFFALDAKTGERLWYVNRGGPNASGQISYAVDGKQYVVGTGQGTLFVFALPD
jgi:outer membrane protein assembly factor BamB